ncbi:MAG: hypothetical protein E6G14_01600, partial [Actinobacteria bacterium]
MRACAPSGGSRLRLAQSLAPSSTSGSRRFGRSHSCDAARQTVAPSDVGSAHGARRPGCPMAVASRRAPALRDRNRDAARVPARSVALGRSQPGHRTAHAAELRDREHRGRDRRTGACVEAGCRDRAGHRRQRRAHRRVRRSPDSVSSLRRHPRRRGRRAGAGAGRRHSHDRCRLCALHRRSARRGPPRLPDARPLAPHRRAHRDRAHGARVVGHRHRVRAWRHPRRGHVRLRARGRSRHRRVVLAARAFAARRGGTARCRPDYDRSGMKGLICAGGQATRLGELTRVTNKHLLPVGGWPMVYYPLQLLQLAGVHEVLIVTGKHHAGQMIDLLGDGRLTSRDGSAPLLDVDLTYKVQTEPGGIAQVVGMAREFAGDDGLVVVLGDNIFERSQRDVLR